MSSYDSLLAIIRDEADTIIEYRKLLEDTECPECVKVINHIIDEEAMHIGEAMYMLLRLAPDFAKKYHEGLQEGDEVVHTFESMLDT